MPTPADEELVQRAQRGDRVAFGDLFERHHQSLLNYVFHMVEDRQQAEDIGHEAFLRAYERLGQLGPPWDFKSWLYRIASNLAVDWLRRRNRWVDETEGALEDEPPTTRRPVERKVDREEQRRRVWNTLGGLATTSRQALILRHLTGLNYQEMAQAMGCTAENARQRVHRARLRFRDAYGLAFVVPGAGARCRAMGDLLSAYHDQELSERERRLVEEHLAACAECREARAGMQRLGAWLAGWPAAPASVTWRQRVLRDAVGPGSPAPSPPPLQGSIPPHSNHAPSGGTAFKPSHVGRGSSTGRGKGAGDRMAGLPASPPRALAVGLATGAGAGLCVIAAAAYLVQRAWMSLVVSGSASSGDGPYMQVDEEGVTRYQQTHDTPVSPDLPIGGRLPLGRTPTPTATVTPSPLASLDAQVIQDANCRAGPGAAYRVLTSLRRGSHVALVGRTESGSWLAVQAAGLLAECWVFGESLDVLGDFEDLPALSAPPLPTHTPTPVPGCLVWVPNLQKNVCTAPCPPNAQPGGTCAP